MRDHLFGVNGSNAGLAVVGILATILGWPWPCQAQKAGLSSYYIEEIMDTEPLDTAFKHQYSQKTPQAWADLEKLLPQVNQSQVRQQYFYHPAYMKQLELALLEYQKKTLPDQPSSTALYLPPIFSQYPPVLISRTTFERLAQLYQKKGLAAAWKEACVHATPGLYIGVADYIRDRLAEISLTTGMRPMADLRDMEYSRLVKAGNPRTLYLFLLENPDYGVNGWMTVGDLFLAQGESDRAWGAWKRLSPVLPLLPADKKAALVMRLAYGSWLMGDKAAVAAFQSQYGQDKTSVRLRGEQLTLAQFLATMASSAVPGNHQAWTNWRGNAAHNALAPALDLRTRTFSGTVTDLSSFSGTIHQPLSWNGRVYFHVPGKMKCVSLETGRGLWEFGLPAPASKNDNVAGRITSGTIYRGRLYVVSPPGEILLTKDTTNKDIGNTLFCIDAMTGKKIWHWPNQASHNNLVFNTAPVIVDDKLLLGITAIKGTLNSELLCVQLSDTEGPKLLWQRFLGSYFPNYEQTTSVFLEGAGVAAGYGLVFCCSNLGFLAAVDILSGDVKWLAKYHDHLPAQYRLRNRSNLPNTPTLWYNLPPTVRQGKLYVTPTDSRHLFVYDAVSGDLQRVFPDTKENSQWNYLLGVGTNGVIYLGSTSQVAALQESGPQEFKWVVRLEENSQGIGLMSADWLYVPTDKYVYQIGLDDGKFSKIGRPSALRILRRTSELPVFPQDPLSLLTIFHNNKNYFIITGRLSAGICKSKN